MLEPDSGVLHCAGQSSSDFSAYSMLLDSGSRPMATMHYFGLKNWGIDAKSWCQAVLSQIEEHPGQFLAVQVGLSMTSDGDPDKHYEGDVASGALDAELDAFLDALASLARPIYLRIGYEFNGAAWNGYQPETYKAAFSHIAQRIRERRMEVALVWDAAAGGESNVMDFYPGDDLVDWWGINWFHPTQLGNTLTMDFLAMAKEHGKPVMVGEASAAGLGSLKGQARWDKWFKPHFQIVKNNPHIKMITYINTNWAGYPDFPQWKSWGDARIQIDSVVTRLYRAEMASTRYIHGADESISRARLYASDGVAPQAITGLEADGSIPGAFRWSPLPDVAAYLIDKNGKPFARSATPGFHDASLGAGQSARYRVQAIRWSGEVGPASTELPLQMPRSVERIANGTFATDSAGWAMLQFEGAAGTFATTTDGASGRSIRVIPTTTTGTNWHLQFCQSLRISAGMSYTVRFRARADSAVAMEPMIQQIAEPYEVYGSQMVSLTRDWKPFSFKATATNDVDARLTFLLGASRRVPVELDDISVIEESVGSGIAIREAATARTAGIRLVPHAGSLSIVRAGATGRILISAHRLDGAIHTRGTLELGEEQAWIALTPGAYLIRSRSTSGESANRVTVLP